MGGVPGLQQAERDEGIDVMAQQVAGEPRQAVVAGAFADALRSGARHSGDSVAPAAAPFCFASSQPGASAMRSALSTLQA